MNDGRSFKTLSIDGGGIKGLYSAQVLVHLEEEFECQIADYFDLLCGTSTGGLIALALSLRIPASEIVNFYKRHKDLIFPQMSWVRSKWRQYIYRGKYDNTQLRRALESVFGSRKIGESDCLLCIPSYSLDGNRPYIFKFDHKEGNLSRGNQTSYVDVALATSAAPTYFPIVEIDKHQGHRFIDGGVYANNPASIAFIEALAYFVGPNKDFDHLKILSVASMETDEMSLSPSRKELSAWNWRKDLLKPFSAGQSHTTHYMLNQLSDHALVPCDYYLIKSPKLSAQEVQLVSMDNATGRAIEVLVSKANDQGHLERKESAVRAFFEQEKLYQT